MPYFRSYTKALTIASTIGGQTRWSDPYFKETPPPAQPDHRKRGGKPPLAPALPSPPLGARPGVDRHPLVSGRRRGQSVGRSGDGRPSGRRRGGPGPPGP